MDNQKPIFVGSQVGGSIVVNYGYTDQPWKLMAWDVYHFFYYLWAIPWLVVPVRPCDSGHLSELSPTFQNIWCLFIHSILIILQVTFILCLPLALFLPVWLSLLAIGTFLTVNGAICSLLNGTGDMTYSSDIKYAPARPEHAHEQWIFVNGVAVGEHWLKNNINRLALTFKRPILGIHNKTWGIIFDVIECLIQRNLCYATHDTRVCYRIVKEKLYDPDLAKVVLILHSQGGIEGGLVVDWILQELPQDLLSKLEVYTFGNAANHFNNPHRHLVSQQLAKHDPTIAVETMTTTITQSSPVCSPTVEHFPDRPQSQNKRNSMTSIQTQSAAHDRAIAHIEHYAHVTDFVALWGILHFSTSSLASDTVPRFIGRLFIRPSKRGGHQFCQHYLDGMFPLEKDLKSGEFIGAAETSEFMDSVVQLGVEGSASRNAREAFAISWLGNDGFGSGEIFDEVDVHDDRTGIVDGREVRVKDLSRLWLYRNGRCPNDLPPLLIAEPQQVENRDE